VHERLKGIDLTKGVDLGSSERAKGAVRYHVEQDTTWQHHEIATRLYGWTDIFRDRFLDPIARLDRQGKLPGPVLGFEKTDHRILAYYHLGHNAHGLEDEVILNELYLNQPLYCILETVLHENVHLWQQRFGQHPVKRNYHNAEFIDKCESFGLHPLPIFGWHWKPADGSFEQLLKEYGILKPVEGIVMPGDGDKRNWWEAPGKRKEGRSTLHKWECPECGQKARVGTKVFDASCNPCSDRSGKRVSFVLYDAGKDGK
jgi:hypothetical protein